MKKIILIGSILLIFLIVATPVSAGWWSDFWDWVLGRGKEKEIPLPEGLYKVPFEFISLKSGNLPYQKICKNVTIGTEYYYTYETREWEQYFCEDEPINKTCYYKMIFYNVRIRHSRPKYGCEELGLDFQKFQNNKEKTIIYDNKHCTICGKQLICWNNNDGWSDDRAEWAKCKCLSGESCVVYDLKNNFKVIYSKQDKIRNVII